jgi:hypothetical protein
MRREDCKTIKTVSVSRKVLQIAAMVILFSVSSLYLKAQIATTQIMGFNFSTMDMHVNNESVVTDGTTGIHFGLLLPIDIVNHFSVQPGVLFSSKGSTYFIDTVDINISPIYMEIPVNMVFDIGTDAFSVTLLAGTYFSCGVGGNKIESGGEAKKIFYGSGESKDLKLFDLGLNVGAGIKIKGFLISARYGYGLTNVFPDDSSDTVLSNRVISVSLTSSFAGR